MHRTSSEAAAVVTICQEKRPCPTPTGVATGIPHLMPRCVGYSGRLGPEPRRFRAGKVDMPPRGLDDNKQPDDHAIQMGRENPLLLGKMGGVGGAMDMGPPWQTALHSPRPGRSCCWPCRHQHGPSRNSCWRLIGKGGPALRDFASWHLPPMRHAGLRLPSICCLLALNFRLAQVPPGISKLET